LSGVPVVSEKTVDQTTGVKTTSTDLTFGTPTISAQIAQVRISGGLDKTLYEVTFRTGTSLGNTVEAEGLLHVLDTI
jgi:hypothetical protein